MTTPRCETRKPRSAWRCWAIGVLVVFSLAVVGCTEPVSLSVAGVPLALRGRCELRSGSEIEPSAVKLDSLLRPGDSLHTLSDSDADLELLGNTLIRLMPASEVKLTAIALTKDGEETGDAIRHREVRLALSRGALLVAQEEEPGMAATLRLAVETAQGVAQTNFDAVFRIEADEQRTRIVCASGSLLFRPAADAVAYSLKAGFVGEWSAEKSDVKPSETELSAQGELSALLVLVPKLRAQRDARCNEFPIAVTAR